jgi:RNA polymerase sigma factor (sigma-70 family)
MADADDDRAAIDAAIVRTQAGDAEAFTAVVERWQRPLRAWIAARCPPELDADGIAVETLTAAFARITDYRPGSDPAAWLWAIARFQLKGAFTRLGRQRDARTRHWPALQRTLLERQLDDEGPDARLPALAACLGLLAAPARQVVDLHYRDGVGLAAIAQRLGRSAGALKKQLFTIRRTLHDCIVRRQAGQGA